jgi:hypothetical protein
MTTQVRRALRWTRRLAVVALVGLAMLGSAERAAARTTVEMRATTIARMLRFVDWSIRDSGEQLRVAVVGNPSLAAALRQACASLQPGGRTIVVIDVASTRALADRSASVVVLGAVTAPLATQLADQGILTVGDGECPDHTGLVLNLLADGDRYRFSANPVAAAKAGVNLSSRLLRLAQIVN